MWKRLRFIGISIAMMVGIFGASAVTRAAPSVVFVDDDCSPPTTGSLTDPYCTIQEGVDAVAANGSVVVRPGSYPELVSINKPLLLQGPTSGGAAKVNNLVLNASGITVTRFSIIGGSGPLGSDYGITTSPSASGYMISYNDISGGDAGIGFSSNGTLPSTVNQNLIHDNTGLGIGIIGIGAMNNTAVDHNQFKNQSSNSIWSPNASTKLNITFNTSTDVVVPFNIAHLSNFNISHNTSSGFTAPGAGIYLAGGNSNGVIEYNTMTGSGNFPDQGIFFNNTQGVNSGLQIRYNTISGMGGNGIVVDSSSLSTSAFNNNNISSNGNGNNVTDGIKINGGGNTGLTLNFNRLKNNFEHDLHDNTGGSGTAGTGNKYLFNYCNSSAPVGLCFAPNP